MRVGRWAATALSWPGGEALAWQAGPIAYTAVGDAPVGEVALAAASVPSPVRLSWVARLRRASRAVAEAISG